MNQILSSAGFDPKTFANLLGVSPRLFAEWIAGQRPMPHSVLLRLSAAVGVPDSLLLAPSKHWASEAEITPAIWYKLRSEDLGDSDRECILLIRLLGHFIGELEEITGNRAVGWESLFEDIRRKTDIQAPPREQGRQAARMYRESRGLDVGQTGIGEVFRENLRTTGILVVESPLPESKVEGCAFYVGAQQSSRPCVFANTHHGTWFRRNGVLMHELAHAIFDARSSGASLDYLDSSAPEKIAEERAEAFSQEALVPFEVLRHLAQAHGIKWSNLTVSQLAALVAQTHAEQKLVVKAALGAGLIDNYIAQHLAATDISTELPKHTDHALSTQQYLEKVGHAKAEEWLGKRDTTIPSRTLRLPVHYVNAVLHAHQNGLVSRGRAAELLMVDERVYEQRYGDLVSSPEEP